MASIILRSGKEAPLSIAEMDNNFSNLNIELGTKLDSSVYTALDILAKLKTVDGSGSGLDADLLKGRTSETTPTANTLALRDANGNISATSFIGNLTGNVTGNAGGTASNITGLLAIANGGTGGTSTTSALNNLLPSGEVSGFVLKTNGPGSYFWGAQTGNVTTAGTKVESTRQLYTAVDNQTLFTGTGTYTPGANQLRVYINGVRQFDSAYTETSSTSFTLTSGVSVGTEVMAEVDGYIEYDLAASEVSYSPTNGITSTNTQDAVSEVFSYTVPSGGIIMWSGSIANIPAGWLLCNGSNGTPNLVDRFVVGAGSTYSVGATGGSANAIVVSHTHTGTGSYRNNYLARVELSTGANGGSTDIAEDGTISPWITSGRNDGGSRALRFQNKGYNSTSLSITNSTTGSNGVNANLPPYYALCYIMKS